MVEIIHKLCNTKLRLAKTTSSLKHLQSSDDAGRRYFYLLQVKKRKERKMSDVTD